MVQSSLYILDRSAEKRDAQMPCLVDEKTRKNRQSKYQKKRENEFFKRIIIKKKKLESWFFHLMQALEKEQSDTQLRQTYPSASVHLIIFFLSLSFQ